MTDIELIKALIGNDSISDDIVSFYLDSTTKFIKAYCNIEYIPEGLKPTLIELTAQRVKANTAGSSAAIGEGLKQVGSVSDGNQSVSYVTGTAGAKQFVSEEDFIAAYGTILDSYRKMKIDKSPRCGFRIKKIGKPTRW